MKPGVKVFVVLFAISFFVGGCALFTTHYDATRHENFTKLKAFHIKFVEDYTEGSGKNWNEQDVRNVCDQGDIKFREALEYAASQDNRDNTGQRAVSNLYDQFKEDCALCMKRGKLFSVAWATEHLEQIKKNYDYAVSGELSRVDKP